jgi:phenylacetate-coenzyme A ligase PaaK-like adenylate-forming protein
VLDDLTILEAEASIGVPGVRQFQLVPHGDGLEVRLVVREGADGLTACRAAERDLAALLEAQNVDPNRVGVVIVDTIERTGTGAKLKLVGMD